MNIINTIINLDVSIYVYIGLLLFLVVGIIIKDSPKNIKDYSLGNQPFSTPVLIATMAATLIGGGSTIGEVGLFYNAGLLLVLPGIIGYLGYFIIIYCILPRFNKYYGAISIASVLSKIYGISVERFSGIVASLYCFCLVALQVKVIGIIIQYALGYNSIFATILSFLIITIYSAFGGIKSVIRTDIVQFIIFIVLLPIIASALLKDNGGIYSVFEKVTWEKSANFNLINYISLFIFCLTPNISPHFIHRLLVGRNNNNNKKTIYFTALIQILCSVFAIIVAAISIVKYQGVDRNIVFFESILGGVTINLFKGAFAVAMLAIVLSTADSLMNTGAIIFVENVIRDKINDEKTKLFLVKVTTILSGFIGIFIALKAKTLLEVIWFIGQYYFVTIFVPFVGGLFVNNAKPIMFWTSSLTGVVIYTLLKIVVPNFEYLIYVISLIGSTLAFMLSKYLVQNNIKITSLLFENIRKYSDDIIKKMNIPETKLGYAIIPMSFFTLILEVVYDAISINTGILEFIAALIGLSFIFIDRIFTGSSKTIRNYYILFSIWYCFPFLAAYLYSMLPNMGIAFANMVITCTFLAIIFSSRVVILFLTTGTLLGCGTYVVINKTNLIEFLPQIFILAATIFYIVIISCFILKEKEIGIKKFIEELLCQTSGKDRSGSFAILNQYSEVIDVFKRYERAKKVFLEKCAGFNWSGESRDFTTLYMDELVRVLKDYISLLALGNRVSYEISNSVKNITTNKPIAMIYTMIFSLSTYMSYFNQRIIKVSIARTGNILQVKYNIPGLKLQMQELIKYITTSEKEEGIVKFDIVKKIIEKEQDMSMYYDHKTLILSLPIVEINVKGEEVVNITHSNVKHHTIH